MRSLSGAFSADRIDQSDLQQIIQRHFPNGSQPTRREVIYPGDEPHAIKLLFSKDDRLTDIQAGPGLTAEREAAIVTDVTNALTPSGPGVYRRVLFAAHKLIGVWGYADKFQVSPVPADAPQLNCLLGDHPFILETKITCVNDHLITSRKAGRALREQELLLAGLVNPSIHELEARPLYGYWVNLPTEDHNTVYLMPGYHYKSSQSAADFSEVVNRAPVIPSSELFGPHSMSAGTPFTFPNELDATLNAYYNLSETEQQRCLRSCYWLQYANRAFLFSYSAAFMAVVTAAEVLFPPPVERCLTCGQPKHRLRSAFAQLLDRSLTLLTSQRVGEDRLIQTRLKHLYDTRSEITHGADLRGALEFTPRGTQDDDDLRTLLRIVPYALSAWINEQASRQERPFGELVDR
jgi:hypothetical protein